MVLPFAEKSDVDFSVAEDLGQCIRRCKPFGRFENPKENPVKAMP
jgi:hypothetical protein